MHWFSKPLSAQIARAYVAGAITLLAVWAVMNAASLGGGSNTEPRKPYWAALDALAPFDLLYAALAIPIAIVSRRTHLPAVVLLVGFLTALAGLMPSFLPRM